MKPKLSFEEVLLYEIRSTPLWLHYFPWSDYITALFVKKVKREYKRYCEASDYAIREKLKKAIYNN